MDLAHVLCSVLRSHTWLDRYEISELQSGMVWYGEVSVHACMKNVSNSMSLIVER